MQLNNIAQSDCLEYLAGIADNAVDHCIIDPPYGQLSGHKIERKVEPEAVLAHIARVVRDKGFVCIFGMMPSICEWHLAAEKAGLKFRDHIVWAKRTITAPYLPIQRTHESIYIYTKGKGAPDYVETEARYEDLKTPALNLGLYELQTIKTIIADLQRRVNDNAYNMLYYKNVPANMSKNIDLEVSKRQKKVRQKDEINIKHDKQTMEALWAGRYPNSKSFRFVSKWYCNVTNLWSFLPENQTKFGANGVNIKHPTVKPTLLLNRLIELISKPNETILDCYMGSGSTARAAILTGRNFVGCEIDPEYHAICLQRIEDARAEKAKNDAIQAGELGAFREAQAPEAPPKDEAPNLFNTPPL